MPSLVFIVCLLVLVCGCASKPRADRPVKSLLAAGDCVVVTTAHRDHPEHGQLIDSVGDISLPLLGRYHIAGFTLKQAEEQIERDYVARGFYSRIDLVVLRCP